LHLEATNKANPYYPACNEDMYDLHVHTTASDGIYTPEQIVAKAFNIRLAGLAVTDHDTVDGSLTAAYYLEENKMRLNLIPGIEMNTEMNGYEIHILGYYIDCRNERLLHHLEKIKEARCERAKQMIQKLRAMGLNINFERVQEIAINDLIARPHIARALVEKGYILTEKAAFDKYIGQGGPAYVPRYKFTPETAIDLIKKAGGVSVLAHPGLINNDQVVNMLIEMGIEGIEVHYPKHDPEESRKYMSLCLEKNLLITGGSDFHGSNSKEISSDLGSHGVSSYAVRSLEKYINRKKQKMIRK